MKKTKLLLLFMSITYMLDAQTPSNLWTPQGIGLLPKDHDILAMSIVNKDVVWALADSTYTIPMPTAHVAKVLKTTNGGATWQLYRVVETPGLVGLDIHAIDTSVAFITAQKPNSLTGNAVFKTTDGGNTWVSKYEDYAASSWVRFFDAKNGIIWNRHRYALTTDGGNTWGAANLAGYLNTEGHAFAAGSNSCAVVGDSIWAGTTISRIVFSPDKGTTWQFQDLRPIAFFGDKVYIISIAFKDARNGLVLGWNSNSATTYLAKTTDGGKTWVQTPSYPFTFGSNIEFIKGTTGSFVITDNEGLTAYSTNLGQSWVKIDSLPTNAVRFLNVQTGWAGRTAKTAGTPSFFKWNGGNILSSIKVLEAEEVGLKVSPNPSNRFINIEYNADFNPTSLTIYDASGKRVFEQKGLSKSTQTIDIQSLANGVHLVQLRSTEGYVSKKIVVQH